MVSSEMERGFDSVRIAVPVISSPGIGSWLLSIITRTSLGGAIAAVKGTGRRMLFSHTRGARLW